jgi:hypothetical protein
MNRYQLTSAKKTLISIECRPFKIKYIHIFWLFGYRDDYLLYIGMVLSAPDREGGNICQCHLRGKIYKGFRKMKKKREKKMEIPKIKRILKLKR